MAHLSARLVYSHGAGASAGSNQPLPPIGDMVGAHAGTSLELDAGASGRLLLPSERAGLTPSPSGGGAMAGRYSQSPAALLDGQLSSWASTGTAPHASGSLAQPGEAAGGGAEHATWSGSLAGSLPYPGLGAAARESGPAPERLRLPVGEAGRARPVLHFRLHGQDKVRLPLVTSTSAVCRPTSSPACKQSRCCHSSGPLCEPVELGMLNSPYLAYTHIVPFVLPCL